MVATVWDPYPPCPALCGVPCIHMRGAWGAEDIQSAIPYTVGGGCMASVPTNAPLYVVHYRLRSGRGQQRPSIHNLL